MNAPAHSEVGTETDQVKGHVGNQNGATVPEAAPADEQTQPGNAVGSDVLGGSTFETFSDGAGI
jgi:hypothetical protein